MTTESISTSSGVAVQVTQSEVFASEGKKTQELYNQLSTIGRSSVSVFTEYAKNMGGIAPPLDKCVQNQVGLYRAIVMCINKNDKDFSKTWQALLDIVNDPKNMAFHESRLFAYMPYITLDEDQRRSFRHVFMFMKMTADERNRRSVLQQIDFSRLLQTQITEEGRNRLINFYQKYLN